MSKVNQKIEIETILIATNPCIMVTSGLPSLTVGKEYKVIENNVEGEEEEDGREFSVLNDDNELHYFPENEILQYFNFK